MAGNEQERRTDLAYKVATLEERSINTQKQLERIEKLLTQHTVHEEKMIASFTKSVQDLATTIDTKIEPIKEVVDRWKWVLGAVIAIGAWIGSMLPWGAIWKFFTGH